MSLLSERSARLPRYQMAEIAAIKRRLLAEGRDVIDLGAGDADFPPPTEAVEALRDAVGNPAMSRYGFQIGLPRFREAAAAYMKRRFGVTFDPFSEILPLLGTKEGLAHLPFAVTNPGDVCIVPEPGYPPYIGGAILAGNEIELCPLRPRSHFLLDIAEIPADRLKRARLLFLNYPNNPTTAVAPLDYLRRTVELCRTHRIVLAYDNPYCEITFDGYRAPSIFEVPGARDVAIEFHSLSKSFSMTGWRIGWAAGNEELIAGLTQVKSYVDTGGFMALQQAGAAVLEHAEGLVETVRAAFERRRDAGVRALLDAGFNVLSPRATMYLWVPLPEGVGSAEFGRKALQEEALAILPGAFFGPGGEGFFRIALTVGEARLREAVQRISRTLDRMGVTHDRS